MKREEFIDFVSKCIAVDKIHALLELEDELKHYLPEDAEKIETAMEILSVVVENQTFITTPVLKQFEE
jgi:hypothetical protein